METSAIFTNSLVEMKPVAPAASAFLFQILHRARLLIPAERIWFDSIRPEMLLSAPVEAIFTHRHA
jgi:hypothetical protein